MLTSRTAGHVHRSPTRMPPPREQVHVAAPAIAAGGKVITSPFQFFADGSETLRLRVWSSLVTTVGLQGRWLRTTNDVHPFRHDFATTADRLPIEFNIPIDAGYMLNCSLGILGATITSIGQTFVQLALIRGRGDAGIEVGTILQGYVATSHWLGFPGSPIQHSKEGPGHVHIENSVAPVAGANAGIGVPEHAYWRVHSVHGSLVTDTTVTNRFPHLTCFSGVVNPVWKTQAPFPMVASSGFNFFWMPNVPYGPAATQIADCVEIPLPEPCIGLSLEVIRTDTPNLQAGDQWSALRLRVEEWLDTDFFGAPL